MKLETFVQLPQFSLSSEEKKQTFFSLVNDLHLHHLSACEEYKQISEKLFGVSDKVHHLEELPYLPVSLFKERYLASVSKDEVYKVLTSSGTTSQTPSRIVLDKEAAKLQTIALSKIMAPVLGNERLPMIIVDSQSVLKNRQSFSARGAGILGLSVFGKKHLYLLDDEFKPRHEALQEFLHHYSGKPMIIFGFTFMVWLHLYLTQWDFPVDLSQATLIHSGGWKKLQEKAVGNNEFKSHLKEKFGLERVYNFYGMVEQIGSIFLENSQGYLHCPNFSEVIIRDPKDFSICPKGKEGLVQVLSVLPRSYPGHSILTEDIGVIEGENDTGYGWKGNYFRIIGRAKKAELRGCSDTYAQPVKQ